MATPKRKRATARKRTVRRQNNGQRLLEYLNEFRLEVVQRLARIEQLQQTEGEKLHEHIVKDASDFAVLHDRLTGVKDNVQELASKQTAAREVDRALDHRSKRQIGVIAACIGACVALAAEIVRWVSS